MIEEYRPLSRRAVLAAMIVLPSACVTKGVPRAPADWPLWRTRQNGADIYLFGGATPLRGPFASARIEAALAASDYLWTETLPKTRAPMDELIKRHGLASKGSLTALLTPRDKVRLDRAAQKVKIPVASLEPFRPWIAAASLQDAFYPAVGRTGSRANDVLIAQAEAAGKPIFAEFPARDDIFAVFGAMPSETDLQFLRYTLDEILDEPEPSETIASAWAQGDMEPAARSVARMKRVYPALYAVLTMERNREWVPRVQRLVAEKKSAFIMVGMFHLVGPDSVQRLLNAAGIKLEQA